MTVRELAELIRSGFGWRHAQACPRDWNYDAPCKCGIDAVRQAAEDVLTAQRAPAARGG